MVAFGFLFLSKAVNMGISVNPAQARTAMMSTGHRDAVKCAMITWTLILSQHAQLQPLPGHGLHPSAVLQPQHSHLEGYHQHLVAAVLLQPVVAGSPIVHNLLVLAVRPVQVKVPLLLLLPPPLLLFQG